MNIIVFWPYKVNPEISIPYPYCYSLDPIIKVYTCSVNDFQIGKPPYAGTSKLSSHIILYKQEWRKYL